MSSSESGAAPGTCWSVEFTQSAAADVRTLPAVVRNALADVFDAMSSGPPADAVQSRTQHDEATRTEPGPPAGSWSLATRSGHLVRFTLRSADRIILVFGVDEGSDPVRATRPRVRLGLPEAVQECIDETRFALRGLRRAPAFTLGVILTLAVGMGGASTIFGLVHTVFRGDLPFEDDARVVRIRSRTTGSTGEIFAFNVTPRDFELVRDGNRVFEGVAAQQGSSISLIGEGAPERASVIGVSQGWAGLLGLRPYLGRAFTAAEEALGEEAGVALISHSLWQSRFGGDPSALGEDLAYDGGRMTIVGVMAPRFAYPYDAQVWTPWRADGTDWTSSDLNVVARLIPGVDVATASADVDRVYTELQRESPGTTPNEGFQVVTSRDDLIRTEAAALQSLALAVLFLLILVCVNVANLFVARRAGQRREFAVRAALGAGRGRLSRAAVLESVIVFAIGAILGLALVVPLGGMAAVLIPEALRSQADLAGVRIGLQLIAFTLLIAVAAGALTGFLASRSNRGSDLQAVLRDGSRGTSGSSGRLRDGLVIAELALSMMLLVGAGVLSDHFRRLQNTDLGFRTEDVITAQVALQHERFGTAEARAQLVREVEASIGALAGVEGVAVTSVNPLCCGDWGARVRIEGIERSADAPPITLHHRYVSSAYFETLGVPIVRGRGFTAADRVDTTPSVVIDEDLANRFWPGEDPIGRRIGLDRPDAPWYTIVGVAARAHTEGDPRESWYLSFAQDPLGRSNEIQHLMVRGAGVDVTAVRTAVAGIDPALAVYGAARMDDLRSERLAQDRMSAAVAAAFALAGLLLAAVGLYGLLAYQVELRQRELGMRAALGASRTDIGALVFAHTGRLLAVGLLVGGVAAYGMNEAVVRVIDGVRLASPVLFGGLAMVLALSAILATVVPARRALRSDPARVFQGE